MSKDLCLRFWFGEKVGKYGIWATASSRLKRKKYVGYGVKNPVWTASRSRVFNRTATMMDRGHEWKEFFPSYS